MTAIADFPICGQHIIPAPLTAIADFPICGQYITAILLTAFADFLICGQSDQTYEIKPVTPMRVTGTQYHETLGSHPRSGFLSVKYP
ncbi:MAG: hypothetical protein J6Y89_04880 [Lachnospiraceae bacterium]|nr:hypothetical protein [Lachnospiraceae bacterium]